MTKKLLVVCGPTATGKTSLALKLAKKFNGEIISADSRQVYVGMDVGTGKDLPPNAKRQMLKAKLGGVYKVDGIPIWGYDLVSPKREFSVSHYVRIARKILEDIWQRDKLPILVGGTGLYIKGVVDGIPTANIPKNIEIRKNLESKTVGELFEILAQLDSLKAASLNLSDRKNPRRLIRSIEIAQWRITGRNRERDGKKEEAKDFSVFFVGLTTAKEVLKERIKKRVRARIKKGIEREIGNLIKAGVSWSSQAMNSIGYKEWKEYLKGDVLRDGVIESWIREEIKYAKRQMTWFKKDKRINWFDSSKRNFIVEVEKKVEKWYKN